MNDDVNIGTHDWVRKSIAGLPEDLMGMTGPRDHVHYTPRLVTQAFVHRTHMQIFDPMYPFVFPNWYMDDWMWYVYGPKRSSFLDVNVINTPHEPRYGIDWKSLMFLSRALEEGCLRIANFLHQKGDPDWEKFECTSTSTGTKRYFFGLLDSVPLDQSALFAPIHSAASLPLSLDWNSTMALARTASGNDMESVWEWIKAAKALKRQYVIFALDGKASTLLGEKGEPFF